MSDSAAVDVSSKDDGAGEGRKRLLISNGMNLFSSICWNNFVLS